MAYVGDNLTSFATEKPERSALKCGAAGWTWRELIRDIEAVECHIQSRAPRGGRIALFLHDPTALLICFFACVRTGRVAVVADAAWPQGLKSVTLSEVKPDLCIDDKSFAADCGIKSRPERLARAQEAPPGEADLFYAGFTSGTSGAPKGYVRTHGSWLKSFELSNRAFGVTRADRVVLPGGLTHSLHLYGAVCGLACGREVVLLHRFDPRAVLSELGGAGSGAVLYATPTQLHYLCEAARRSGPVDTVRQVLASGAKWRDKDRTALAGVFPKAQLIEFYGASETSFIAVSRPRDKVPAGSVGRAATGVQLVIGDPHDPAPAGRSGPIWVRSGMLFSGYICGDAPQTRWRDGWLTFGDDGYLDSDGFLFLTGRGNRMIITGGLNVYPEEIEAVLEDHPAVAVAVVAGLPDSVRGHRLEAAVQLSGPLPDAASVLRRHCAARLATGKVPRKFHIRENLPVTAGGKPDIQRVVSDLLHGEGKEDA
ncbi:AMP-binding protein [Roseibium marinum]|uniref:Long-chain acyl-CoA synthetase n=1 Tax=Roseibium marinum TaxID=281252 RepID=A0A2S3UZ98_9HYPH|nr:AMP-binding protein [Roseibium marinum]POF33037.1 long-chain acyl-CoA synthetase [Roseibium marinum]